MNLLNVKIIHKDYGTGVVIEAKDDMVKIQFESKIKQFVYPGAFEKSLTAEDNTVQQAIEAEIAKKKDNKKIKEEFEKEKLQQPDLESKSKRRFDSGFGPDYNVRFLSKSHIYTYRQIEKQFQIKISGFGRGINVTPSAVVLISSVDSKSLNYVYHDHWSVDGDYIYSGEGKIGDQTMTSGNKAIVDAEKNGKKIYLYVKFSPTEYYYQGQFFVVDYTYENAKDEDDNIRKEYKFRLRNLHFKEK